MRTRGWAGRCGIRNLTSFGKEIMAKPKVAFLVFALFGAIQAGYSQRFRFHLQEATIDDVHQAIREGQITCRGLVQLYINRAKAYNGVADELVTRDGAPIPPAPGVVRLGSPLKFPTATVAISSLLPDFDQYAGPPIEFGRMEPTASDPGPVASAPISPAPVAVSGGNNVPVTLACPAAVASGCDGQVILALSGGDPAAKLVAARRERRTVIGKSGKFHIAAGHTTTVPVRLSRRGARILRTRGHSHKVLKLEATVVMKTAAGTTSTTTTITVRAARRRPTPHRKRR